MRHVLRKTCVAVRDHVWLLTMAAALLAFPAAGHAQYSASQGGLSTQSPTGQPTTPLSRLPNPDQSDQSDQSNQSNQSDQSNPIALSSAARRQRMLEEDRHKKLLAQTEKLLALATQLHDEVQKTSKDELNVDVVKKAGEMEKLSRDVKNGMVY